MLANIAAAVLFGAITLICLARMYATHVTSLQRMERNGWLLTVLVQHSPHVLRALDTPEPRPLRIPAWIPQYRYAGSVMWVDRDVPPRPTTDAEMEALPVLDMDQFRAAAGCQP
jgi:hypothetical protein